MTCAAGEPPFALDGTVMRDKLAELLNVQTEQTESCCAAATALGPVVAAARTDLHGDVVLRLLPSRRDYGVSLARHLRAEQLMRKAARAYPAARARRLRVKTSPLGQLQHRRHPGARHEVPFIEGREAVAHSHLAEAFPFRSN